MSANLDPSLRDLAPVQPKRSFFLGLLIVGYALFSLAGWVRLVETILDWHWLSFAGLWPGPLYLAVTGVLWGLVGLVGAIWLWRRVNGWRLAGSGVALLLALTYWVDQLLVASLDRYGSNALFGALITFLGLLYTLAVLRPWEESGLFKRR
ncbi:MAG TPA: hypothetical protein VF806_03550 [Anaerolineaceae bacterium]